MSFPFTEPTIIKGGVAVDDRGSVRFANDFNFPGVKRFYMIQNHTANFVRAWHGHKNEGKFFFCTSGSFLIGAVKIDDWSSPSKDLKAFRQVISAENPSVIAIPPGYANGLMSLTADARLMVFSTSVLQDSLNDDIRFPGRYWDIWSVEER